MLTPSEFQAPSGPRSNDGVASAVHGPIGPGAVSRPMSPRLKFTDDSTVKNHIAQVPSSSTSTSDMKALTAAYGMSLVTNTGSVACFVQVSPSGEVA